MGAVISAELYVTMVDAVDTHSLCPGMNTDQKKSLSPFGKFSIRTFDDAEPLANTALPVVVQ